MNDSKLLSDEVITVVAQWGRFSIMEDCFNLCQRVVGELKFPGYTIKVDRNEFNVWLSISYNEPDTFTGVNELQQGRRWLIENDWNEVQIIQTAFKAILTSLEHRAREHFTYKDRAILNPHHSLAQLYELGQERAHEAQAIEFT